VRGFVFFDWQIDRKIFLISTPNFNAKCLFHAHLEVGFGFFTALLLNRLLKRRVSKAQRAQHRCPTFRAPMLGTLRFRSTLDISQPANTEVIGKQQILCAAK
jgi:hypothetical protein